MTVPEGWKRRKLGNLLKTLRNGYVCAQSRSGEGLPISRIETISHGVVDPDSVGYAEIPLADRDKFKMQVGDILLSHINSLKHIGKSALYTEDINLYHGMNLMLLRAERGIVTPDFLHSILISDNARNHIRRYAKQAINQASVNKKDIAKMDVLLPPLPEQKKIAAILSSVDETIQATRETIEQTKKVKQGLLQELLTRGIGHTKFKKTEIGEIPEEWRLTNLGSISDIRRGASPRPIRDPKWFSDHGYGWVRIEDVTRQYKYLRETKQYLSKAGVRKSVPVHTGDVIMSICATIGMPSIVDMDACIHDGFVLFGQMSQRILREYLFYYLLRRKESFSGKGQPGTQKNINTSIVKQTALPLPPLEEQRDIANILSAIDSRIEEEEADLDQLQFIKNGLMQDLLTGKVRVAV